MCLPADDKQLEASRRYRKRHPQRVAESNRQTKLRQRYGIDLDEYRSMLDAQDNACAICAIEHRPDNRLHVDHCHDTMRVRGLLCQQCNVALGRFEDDRELLERAIDYLTRFPLSASTPPRAQKNR